MKEKHKLRNFTIILLSAVLIISVSSLRVNAEDKSEMNSQNEGKNRVTTMANQEASTQNESKQQKQGAESNSITEQVAEADTERTYEQEPEADKLRTSEQESEVEKEKPSGLEQQAEKEDNSVQETDVEKETAAQEKLVYTGSIKMSKKVSMKEGEEYKLNVTLTEKNNSGEKVKFTSSDKSIVSVTKEGVLKAKHWGEATISATLGKAKASCKVTVTKEVQITISATGDVTLSSDIKQPKEVNFFSVYDKVKDNAYFFKNVKSIFEKDDMTIVNFEGTLSNRGSRVDKQWAFRGKPSYIDILKEGSVEAVAFANNHVKDYGEVSYTDTIETFKKADITYSSYSTVGVYEVKGIKIGMISIQECGVAKKTYEDTLRKAIKAVKKKKPDLLIVSFHWGIEYTFKPNKAQIDLSRIAIDEGGADLVLGHHPHVLQPIEKYKDAYIVYSLGNFCFGGNTNPRDKDTMIYQQTFTFRNDKLVPDDNIRIIPCSVSSVTSKNNYQPTPSKGSEKERIIKRMNDYCKPYGISFDKDGKLTKKKLK